MEQWEHMAVESHVSPDLKELVAFTPDGNVQTLDTENVGIGRVMRALGALGREGWQLVSTDITSTVGLAIATYYLRRRLPDRDSQD